jgi:hypothetical protein
MADIEHSSIADPQIHEPKGAATASDGDVYAANGLGSGAWVPTAAHPHATTYTNLLASESTLASQGPTVVDTPHQITFGPAQTITEFDVAADGSITVLVTGVYQIRFALEAGRAGASGVSTLHFRLLFNGTQVGPTTTALLDSASTTVQITSDTPIDLPAGVVLTLEMIRDSVGNNSGDLILTNPTLAGWNDAPSAFINISRLNVAG